MRKINFSICAYCGTKIRKRERIGTIESVKGNLVNDNSIKTEEKGAIIVFCKKCHKIIDNKITALIWIKAKRVLEMK